MGKFTAEINGFQSWSAIFTNPNIFRPIVEKILVPNIAMKCLPPGTNAVFQCSGDVIVKIFAPPEAKTGSLEEFGAETAGLSLAADLDIPAPRIIDAGAIVDRYKFNYIVMEAVQGVPPSKRLKHMGTKQAEAFTDAIADIIQKLSSVTAYNGIKKRAVGNPAPKQISPLLLAELKALSKTVSWDHCTVVHCDITDDNLILTEQGPFVIDFADCCLMPPCCELPAAVFDVFRHRPDMLPRLSARWGENCFEDDLIQGLSLHDYATNILWDFFRWAGIDPQAVHSIHDFQKCFNAAYYGLEGE